jgi:hypothetical protein
MENKIDFDHYQSVLQTKGATEAIEHLIRDLQKGILQDPQTATTLFYAQLLRKRIELKTNPYPMGSAHELPKKHHETYEDAIRDAAKSTGELLLSHNKIAAAWPFYRLINDTETVRNAIEKYQPSEEDDIYPLLDIAWHQGVHPSRGFQLMLERQGICSTITLISSTDLSKNPTLRNECIGKLVQALHEQLHTRLMVDLKERGIDIDEKLNVKQLVEKYPILTENDAYHVDISHLQSVVQMTIHLTDSSLKEAKELCEYGLRLSEKLNFFNDTPFDEGYKDYLAFLNVISNDHRDINIARFQAKAQDSMQEGIAYPGIVLIDLLSRIGEDRKALDIAKQLFGDTNAHEYGGPNLVDLARKIGDHATVAEIAKKNGDIVSFLASQIAQSK